MIVLCSLNPEVVWFDVNGPVLGLCVVGKGIEANYTSVPGCASVLLANKENVWPGTLGHLLNFYNPSWRLSDGPLQTTLACLLFMLDWNLREWKNQVIVFHKEKVKNTRQPFFRCSE